MVLAGSSRVGRTDGPGGTHLAVAALVVKLVVPMVLVVCTHMVAAVLVGSQAGRGGPSRYPYGRGGLGR